MNEISATLILKALDGLSTRYAFTAQNIANANTPGYQPVHVSFEESLKAAAARGADAIGAVKPEAHSSPALTGTSEMRLDLELASASETALRYRALLDVLSRQMALHRAVVTEGR